MTKANQFRLTLTKHKKRHWHSTCPILPLDINILSFSKTKQKTHKLRHPQGHWKRTPQKKNDPIQTWQNNACVMRFAPKTFRIAQTGVGSMWEAKEVFVALIQMAKWKNSETHKNSCGIWVRLICLLPPIHYLEPHGHLFMQKNLRFNFGSYHKILFDWFFAGKRDEHSWIYIFFTKKKEFRESPPVFGKNPLDFLAS